MSVQMAAIDGYIDHAAEQNLPLAALMLSLPAFTELKTIVPRRLYRKRQGTRFINAYRGIPIELHDEWSWGWMLRTTSGGFIHLPDEEPVSA